MNPMTSQPDLRDAPPALVQTATVADVALPVPIRSTFAYTIPNAMRGRVRPGARVVVPFASRLLTGFVVGLDPADAPAELKPLRSLLDTEPLAPAGLRSLTHWLAERTVCSWGEALKAALPGFSSPKREKVITVGEHVAQDLFGGLSGDSADDRILAVLSDRGGLPLPALAKALGVRVADVKEDVERLLRSKRLKMNERVADSVASGPPQQKMVRLLPAATPDAAVTVDLESIAARAPLQARCIEHLREAGGEMPLRDLAEAVAGARPAVKRLVEKKLAKVTLEEWEGHVDESLLQVSRPTPHPAQADAIEAIGAAITDGATRTFLLHGVTGSGKTEVYLRAMEAARDLGRTSILLVPEITLTPQTVSRLRGRFGARAAVLHSRLTDAERRRTWWAARQGKYDVVLGPRSAIFTPVPNLGLVVIDEEHDGAYKQEDAPRYHARDVAIERARRNGAVVVLGSATPDVETYQRAKEGEYELLRLAERASNLPLPAVRLVDMRSTRGMFSQELLEAIRARLEREEQTILFLNRRGFSPFVQCTACGEALRCDQCAVSLTYHKPDHTLRCHYCDHQEAMPSACPSRDCKAQTLQLRGMGTQRVEEELREHFADARVARLDSDSVRRVGAHEEILEKFLAGDVDILLGTQMVAKGLDFPRVTLVGVINADTGLHLPDYRSTERTFQVLAQVSGRAGRSELGGEVLVQTRCPEHSCLLAAAEHDDAAFREVEIPEREDLRYPPFSRLASVLLRGPDLTRVEKAGELLRDRLGEVVAKADGWAKVLGPAPAPLSQLRGKHRARLLIKGEHREDVRRIAAAALEPLPGVSGVEVIVDIDPLDML